MSKIIDWWSNQKTVTKIVISVLSIGLVATSITLPIVLSNKGTPTISKTKISKEDFSTRIDKALEKGKNETTRYEISQIKNVIYLDSPISDFTFKYHGTIGEDRKVTFYIPFDGKVNEMDVAGEGLSDIKGILEDIDKGDFYVYEDGSMEYNLETGGEEDYLKRVIINKYGYLEELDVFLGEMKNELGYCTQFKADYIGSPKSPSTHKIDVFYNEFKPENESITTKIKITDTSVTSITDTQESLTLKANATDFASLESKQVYGFFLITDDPRANAGDFTSAEYIQNDGENTLTFSFPANSLEKVESITLRWTRRWQ